MPTAQLTDLSDRFDVLRRIGAGGMGVVYEAIDRESSAHVALKTLRRMDPRALMRFKHEFRALVELSHPNLVGLGELFDVGGRLFFTMELVRGVSFLRYVRPASPAGRDASPAAGEPAGDNPFAESGEHTPATAPARAGDATLISEPPDGCDDTRSEAPAGADGSRSDTASDATASKPRKPPDASPRFDEARLRRAAIQLARGVHALHSAGLVHRDIKPSNVLVTDEDRVVLLDFGLVADVGRDRIAGRGEVVGTARFMAPEQIHNADVGAAADWYSVGVVLYTALTGTNPFPGSQADVMRAKEHTAPTPPAELVPGVPRDLSELCVDLLAIDPAARPTGDEVLARLHGEAHGSAPIAAPGLGLGGLGLGGLGGLGGSADVPDVYFVGRVRELAALDAALAAARHGPPLACLLRGESGVGKTALVRHFAEHARDRVGALVLSGRCYQREAVPYKAVDELVDDIVRYLGSLAPDRCRELLPPDVGMLTQLFPVVRRVVPGGPGMARPSTEFGLYEYRTRALAALRALVSALAASQPLVLAVDDLQWSDADSLVLLRALLEPPDAPPVLLLATVRTMDTSPDALGPEALRDALPCEVRELALSRLSDDEARSLVAHLLTSVAPAAGQPGQESSPEARAEIAADTHRTPDPADVDAVVREAGGHPMFLDVLVRHHRVATPGARAVSLEDALWRRVGVLDPGARQLVELAAVAGRPIAQAVAIAALGADPEPFDRGVGALAGARLAATTGRRPSDLLDVCHSRVREAVLANLGGGERTRWHRALAAALEASGEADPEFVASHWRAAGDEARAAGFYERAADAARDSLAFERAARLYRTCLELARDAGHALLLRVELADALMCAGRGTEAAREYLTAAERAGDADALELTRRGAEQLLRSGRVEEGMAALDRVLRAVGLPPIPRSRRVALAKIAWRRSWLAIRGRRHRRRRADELPPEQLARIDACWVAATSLSLCDPLLGVLFQTYHLSLALRAGEPMRAARAIALDAAYASIPGTERYDRTQALIAEAAALADEVDEPQVRAWVGGARGSLAYLSGHWVEAAEQCAATEQEFRSLPTGTTWEMITLQVFYLSALACLGEFKALQSVLPGYIREADSRDDLYGAVALRIGHVNLAWLAADEPGGARAYVREADTKLPDGEFYIPHYYRLLAQTRIDLYEGRTDEARERLEQAWPLVSRAQMTRVQLLRIYAFHIRACVHLAAAEAALATGAGAARGDTARSLRIADRCAARLLRESAPWSVALGQSVKAALSRLRGERAALEPQLLRAADALDVVALPVHAACLRRARGALLGGGEGSIEIEAADLWLASRGVRAPSLLARALVPGLALPEP